MLAHRSHRRRGRAVQAGRGLRARQALCVAAPCRSRHDHAAATALAAAAGVDWSPLLLAIVIVDRGPDTDEEEAALEAPDDHGAAAQLDGDGDWLDRVLQRVFIAAGCSGGGGAVAVRLLLLRLRFGLVVCASGSRFVVVFVAAVVGRRW